MTAAPERSFVLGVNYWPRAKAMGWWADFDAGEVREELAMIRDLGIDVVRVFLLWESFQPHPDGVDAGAVRHLTTVADLALDAGLTLEPTFFTGHMSGPNWAPDWLLDRSQAKQAGGRQIVSLGRRSSAAYDIHDPYVTLFVLDAERLLLRTVCGQLGDHPGIWAWSLGNEPDLFARPATADIGRAWMAEMTGTIREIDSEHPVLVGLHAASLHADVGLRVDHAAAETDVSVMHGYSIYDPLAREPLDPDLVPFTAALTAALAGRPILFEEMGINTHRPDRESHWEDLAAWDGGTRRAFFASEQDAAAYYAAVLDRLHRGGALGAFAWCFGDYAPELWDRPPCDLQKHERFFGLYRADGTLKPMGEVVRRFAAARPTVLEPVRAFELGMSADAFYADPPRHLLGLYARYLAG